MRQNNSIHIFFLSKVNINQALFSQGLMEREGREGKGNVAKQCESKGEKCLNNKISKPLALPTDIPTINTKRVA